MTPPGQHATGRPAQPPPGLGLIEFPSLESQVPTRREVRTIAQKNMMALFGQEVMLIPKTNRVLLGADFFDEDAGLEYDTNLKGGSAKAAHPEGWQFQGSHWRPRGGIASDPGAGKKARHDIVSASGAVSKDGARSEEPKEKEDK